MAAPAEAVGVDAAALRGTSGPVAAAAEEEDSAVDLDTTTPATVVDMAAAPGDMAVE